MLESHCSFNIIPNLLEVLVVDSTDDTLTAHQTTQHTPFTACKSQNTLNVVFPSLLYLINCRSNICRVSRPPVFRQLLVGTSCESAPLTSTRAQ